MGRRRRRWWSPRQPKQCSRWISGRRPERGWSTTLRRRSPSPHRLRLQWNRKSYENLETDYCRVLWARGRLLLHYGLLERRPRWDGGLAKIPRTFRRRYLTKSWLQLATGRRDRKSTRL